MLRKLFACTAVVALLLAIAGQAVCQDAVKDQARCYTTWDANYFYLAFKVDCPDIKGTHKAPNADVSGDDTVEFYLDTRSARSAKLGPGCFSMAVSVAGGSQCRLGDESGSLKPTPVFTFKYGVTVQGTPNNGDDIDQGYTIEMAVPWDVMKTKSPAMGNMMGVNVIVRRNGSKAGEFVSLSPKVKTEEDIADPSKWSSIVFAAHSFGAATLNLDKVVSAKYVVRAPLVDGSIADKEWHRNTSFAVDLPMPPGFVYEAKYPTQRMVLTPYFYWYQADQRKEAPYSHIVGPDGAVQLQHFPAESAGPWFSYDRVQWHKEELSDVVAAGIDVVLPVYRGDSASRAGFAAKGLDCMVSAIRELRDEGKPYPQVAMFFDTTAMMLAYGGQKPDLKSEDARRAFYGMIKDFFERVPQDFRAVAQTARPRAGRPGPIVFLGTSSSFSDLDSSFTQYCDQRFEQDFGLPLIWVASEDFKPKAQGFDGVSTCGAGLGLRVSKEERIHIGAVGAGFDNSAIAAKGKALVRSQMGGETYNNDWAAILRENPHWVVCDAWNGFHEGSELCASREYGRAYIEATRANVNRFLGGRDLAVRYLRYDVPRMIPPKQFAQAVLQLKNVGNSPWKAGEGYSLAYRWYKSGRFYGESKVRRPLGKTVNPGETITVDIGIATVTSVGTEIPEGDCEVRFELVRLSDNKWFSALGDQPLTVPMTIGKLPEWGATFVATDLPAMVASGQSYVALLRIRNDGSETWKKGVTKLGCSLYRVSNYTHDATSDLLEKVATKDIRTLLGKDCKPGEIAEFALDLTLVQPNGKPLAAWKQSETWNYQVRFDLHNGTKWLSELGVRTLNRTVSIFENDYGPRIVDCDLPRAVTAGRTYDTKVVVRNNGTAVWDRKRTRLGYHLTHLDGTEMLWEGETSPIPANIQPGWPVVVPAKVRMPEYDGQYVVVWDVMIDGKWLSTGPVSRGGDILPVFIEVTNGRLAFVDTASLCDGCAISPDTDRALGNFDGAGSSFPAELFPPDIGIAEGQSLVYPVGYQYDRAAHDDGRVSFRFPAKAPGAKNLVSCNGQKVDFDDGKFKAVHILGAAVGKSDGEFSANYSSGAVPANVTMSDWSSGPANGEKIGLQARHRHNAAGDEIGAYCHLYHYSVQLDSSKTLTSLTLPKNPAMKIVAITLERGSLPPAPAPAAEGD